MPAYAYFALIAALGYGVGSLFSKQAMAGGSGLFRVTAYSTWTLAVLTQPFVWTTPEPLPVELWFQPMVAGLFFLGGQLLFILALRTGDLSVVGPVAGAKPIINALLVSLLLGLHVSAFTWLACMMAAGALLVLRSPNASSAHSFGRTAGITLLSALSFALCDTCFQEWAPTWGPMRFSGLAFACSALGALVYIPFFNPRWTALSRTARRHLLLGAAFGAVPGVLMGYALGRYGHAPEVNVIYSTRAVWAIVAVRLVGPWIGSHEGTITRATLWRRLLAALILLLAVGLVVWQG